MRAWLIAAVVFAARVSATAQGFVGTFADDKVTLVCARDGAGKGYSGTIVMHAAEGNRRFAFTAAEQGSELVGRFVVGEKSFEFRAAVEGGVVVFRTGEAEYRLARMEGNKDKGNPLSRPASMPARRVRPVVRPGLAATSGGRAEAIERAIEGAKAYVYSHQKEGNWDLPARAPEPVPDARGMIPVDAHMNASQWGGLSALATYALLAGGESPAEPRVAAAIEWLKRADLQGTYAIACRALVWSQMPQDRRRAFVELAKHDRDLLLVNRRKQPGVQWMFRYTAQDVGFDHSASQFGVLGLWAAEQCGAEVDTRVWRETDAAWTATQLDGGGWSYSPLALKDPKTPTLSMTAAGVASLFITFDRLHANVGLDCRGNVPHKAIDAGLGWIAANYDQTFTGAWPLYTLYGMERIGLASGYKYFGSVDWYGNGVDYLLKTQHANGLWGTGVADTCFGILFMVRGRAPIAMNKLEYEIDTRGDLPKAANWHQRPRDCANFARWMGRQLEREVAWQIVNLKGPAEGLHDSPILFIAGNQVLSFTDADEEKLRTFVRQGGLIVGHADCNHGGFGDAFKKIGTRLFSPYEFRNLPRDHLVYSVLFDGKKWKTPVVMQGISNGARELMILVSSGDPGRFWQTGTYGGREPSYEFMANVLMYVSGGRKLRNRGETHLVLRDENVRTSGATIRVARLAHAGNWDPEPGGWERLAAVMHNEERRTLEVQTIRPGEGKLVSSGVKLAHLTSTGKFSLRDEQRKELKAFIEAGGTLIADACGGAGEAASSIEAEVAAMWPNAKPAVLKGDHPAYGHPGGKGDEVLLRPFAAKLIGNAKGPRLRGVAVAGRLAVIYSREDLSVGLVGQPVEGIIGYTPASATALVESLLLWQNSQVP